MTMLEKLQNGLLHDEVLCTWCNRHLGKLPTVWIGVDIDQEPPDEDYPLICMVSVDQHRATGERTLRWVVDFSVALRCDEDVALDDRGRTWPGMLLVEAFRREVEDAVCRMALGGQASVVGAFNPAISKPYYESISTMTIEQIKTAQHGLGR